MYFIRKVNIVLIVILLSDWLSGQHSLSLLVNIIRGNFPRSVSHTSSSSSSSLESGICLQAWIETLQNPHICRILQSALLSDVS